MRFSWRTGLGTDFDPVDRYQAEAGELLGPLQGVGRMATPLRVSEEVVKRVLSFWVAHPDEAMLIGGGLSMAAIVVIMMTMGISLWQREAAPEDDGYSDVYDDGISDTCSEMVGPYFSHKVSRMRGSLSSKKRIIRGITG